VREWYGLHRWFVDCCCLLHIHRAVLHCNYSMIDALGTHSNDLGSCSSPGCFRSLFLLFSLVLVVVVIVMLDFLQFVVID
jgi:hypothetical protein